MTRKPKTKDPRAARPSFVAAILCLLLVPIGVTGCSALQAIAALDRVQLSLDGVSNGRLAGVDLSGYRTLGDVRPTDLLRIGIAYRQGSLPLDLTLRVGAENPGSNGVEARLERLDWTLRLNDRQAATGAVNRPIVLPAGRTIEIPLDVRVDLLELYGENRDDLVALALRLAGRGAESQHLELSVRPTVTTPLGPMTYPRDIVLTRRDV
jgi:hypothetical protein